MKRSATGRRLSLAGLSRASTSLSKESPVTEEYIRRCANAVLAAVGSSQLVRSKSSFIFSCKFVSFIPSLTKSNTLPFNLLVRSTICPT